MAREIITLICILCQLMLVVNPFLIASAQAAELVLSDACILYPDMVKSHENINYVNEINSMNIDELRALNGSAVDALIFGWIIEKPEYSNKFSEIKNNSLFGSGIDSSLVGVLFGNAPQSQINNYVKGGVVTAADSNAQEWLDQFGTAITKLSLDSYLGLNGSEFDVLFSVYEKNIIFSQFGE